MRALTTADSRVVIEIPLTYRTMAGAALTAAIDRAVA